MMKLTNHQDFDGSSGRDRRKLPRKTYSDSIGATTNNENDICDCLTEDCPGCHFPCPKCRSCKCGFECRVNRKWVYESIKNESEASSYENRPHS